LLISPYVAEFSWGKLTHTENPPKGLKEFQRYGTWPQVVERLSVEAPIIESKPDHSAIVFGDDDGG